MKKPLSLPNNRTNQEIVLTKAVIKLALIYGLKGKELGDIIGISEASASRLYKGNKLLSPQSKEGELALLLIRLYRSLNALLGNDFTKAKAWLNSKNDYFGAIPLEHIKRVDGLVECVNYLDAMRGKT